MKTKPPLSKTKIHNLRFAKALKRKPQSIPPIWFMRQAGRYHTHYQNLKKKHSFVELCKNPELAAQVALGPIQDFDFDVAILFSDILFPLEAMGLNLQYNPGPIFEEKMDSKKLKKLKSLDEMENDLDFQRKALLYTRDLLPKTKSLIGFIGGPWTLFSYAVREDFKEAFLKQKKEGFNLFNDFFNFLIPLLLKNIQLQLKGSAELIMIFDSSAHEVSENLFTQFLIPHLKTLALSFPHQLGYYNRGLSKEVLEKIASFPWGGLAFEHSWKIKTFPPVKSSGFFQGNFDPALMLQNSIDFKKSLQNYLNHWFKKTKQDRLGWILSLGHGVQKKTPQENVKAFVEVAREICFKNS